MPHIPLILSRPISIVSHPIKLCNFPNLELYDPPKLSPRISREGERICGSSRGWICSVRATMSSHTTMSLHNPFTGREIRLPNLPNPAVPMKVVLSSDPRVQPRYCVVMLNCWSRLMFRCRPADASWTHVLDGFPKGDGDHIQDIIFYHNKSYAVPMLSRLFGCDFKLMMHDSQKFHQHAHDSQKFHQHAHDSPAVGHSIKVYLQKITW